MEETKKAPQPHRTLYRSEKDRVLAGVAGGIAAYFEVDSNLVRFLFILVMLLGGSGILIYIVLWILLPAESSASKDQEATVKRNIDEIKGMAKQMAAEIKPHTTRKQGSREWFGIILIIIGALFLLQNFGLLWWFSMEKMWPIILILLGVGVLIRN